jgi:cell division protein FtsI (penicillin-binding protein 3)
VTLVERRIGLLFAGFLALLLIAGGRSFQLGVLSRAKLVDAAASQQLIRAVVPARRGTILDRHGNELAVSESSADITATPYLVKNKLRVAKRIGAILGEPESNVLAKLSAKNGFEYIAKGVPAGLADKVHALGVEGIDLTPGYKRFYPRYTLASQVLGIVGADGLGKAGLEYSLNSDLHGVNGARSTVRDGVGDSVKIRDTIRTQPGEPVQLTIDSAIQSKVEKVLAGIGQTYTPKGATALVMNPKTGDILAMANWPAIDANKPLTASSYVAQNRTISYTYEPGSTFKAITVAGALEDHVVTPNTVFDLPPTLKLYDRTIGESHPRGPISLAVKDILAQSSNVGAVKIAQRMGAKSFDHWARTFGIGSKTGVDLPGEEQGLLLKESQYSGASIGNLPIGQGLAVTPLQMARAYSAIANGGTLLQPHIVRSVDGKPTTEPAGKRIISSQTAAQLRSMLKGVFAPGGTASEVSLPGYDLAGKTGTAQKIDRATGTYSDTRYVASFIGFAPANNPGVLISVMVDEPHGANAGGSVAAPAFGKIAAFTLPYLGIPAH